MQEKPKNVDEYIKWLKDEREVEISNRTRTRYSTVTAVIKQDYENSDFWVNIVESIRKYDEEYLLDTGYRLFIHTEKPELKIKPFESFLLKTFRKNIIDNERYPDEPVGGWILPDNWFSGINDILRTMLVVKYLDGVEFMRGKIRSHCEKYGMNFEDHLEAREEGYYAAHLYTKRKFEIPKTEWDTEKVSVSVEIQITTQLQEVIRRLLHKYYEKRRETIKEEDSKWQWDYRCDEFCANYLGHILHYVEGMIMEIRERQKEETA